MQKTILRFCLVATLFFAGTTLQAQETPVEKTAAAEVPTGIFGYLSYDEVLQAMPAMSVVKAKTQALREQYEKELQRAEDEFNKKYEDFLQEASGRTHRPHAAQHCLQGRGSAATEAV